MYYIELKWKYSVRGLKYQGINNPCIWSRRSDNELLPLYLTEYIISETMSKLLLICLFKD